jgi:hypothetical protein
VGGDTNGDGTATQAAMGDWAKLVITDGGTAAFNHCQFLYGGAGTYQITLDLTTSNNVKVTNCMFAHNDGGTLSGGYGALWTGSAKSGTVVTGNIFYANNVPLSISTAHSLDNTNIFHNPVNPLEKNTYNGIFMAPGGNSTNHVTGNITWSNTEVPYVINKDSVVIDIGATLTLADNVVVKSFGHEVDVWGNLNQGVGNVFTSLYDDTVMGDTNGDGTANVPVVGNWTGIWFNSGAPAPTWVNTQWANWLNMHYEASH